MTIRIAGIMVLAIVAVVCIATPSHTGGGPAAYVHHYGIMPYVFASGSPGGGGQDGLDRMTAILDEISLENAEFGQTADSSDTSDLPMANSFFLIRTGPIRIDTTGGGPFPPPQCPPACPKHHLIVDREYALRLKAELTKLGQVLDSLIDIKPGMKN